MSEAVFEEPTPTSERIAFVEEANARVNEAIRAIKAIGELDHWRGHYTESDVRKIESRVRTVLMLAGNRLQVQVQPDEQQFLLKV